MKRGSQVYILCRYHIGKGAYLLRKDILMNTPYLTNTDIVWFPFWKEWVICCSERRLLELGAIPVKLEE